MVGELVFASHHKSPDYKPDLCCSLELHRLRGVLVPVGSSNDTVHPSLHPSVTLSSWSVPTVTRPQGSTCTICIPRRQPSIATTRILKTGHSSKACLAGPPYSAVENAIAHIAKSHLDSFCESWNSKYLTSQPAWLNLNHGHQVSVSHLTLPIFSRPPF